MGSVQGLDRKDREGAYEMGPCVRSGYCCKKATCTAGVMHGGGIKDCTWLRGDEPGGYSCGLVIEKPELKESMAIGAGCCSPLNSTRQEMLREMKDGTMQAVSAEED